jgi:hypothetical protein
MFKKLMGQFFGGETAKPAAIGIRPYASNEANAIYNLLFCDDASLFAPRAGAAPTDWQATLQSSDAQALASLAGDANQEARVRLLAFNGLRDLGQPVPKGVVLGVVVEVPLEGGLDCLAAYDDGGVRYINQTGKIAIFDGGPPEVSLKAKELVSAAAQVVKAIGPWDKPRLPSPKPGNIRMSFLVSDGLYFGEGPFALMQREPLAAPTIQIATQLLQLVVDRAIGGEPG